MTDSKSIVIGSVRQIANQTGKSLAETFIGVDCVIVVDTSGSMDRNDSRGGKSRYAIACEELAGLQANMPGKIAVIAFSSNVLYCPSGVPTYFGGTTDLTGALKFVRVADTPGMRFIVISDGDPDDSLGALTEAKKFKNKIDTIYVGPEGDRSGWEFLQHLAKVSGGQAVTADRAKELKANIEQILLHA